MHKKFYASPYIRLTGGITLQIAKALSGGYTKLNNVVTQEVSNGIDTGYIFTNGRIEYAYSDNYDLNFSNGSEFAKAFIKNAKTGLGMSLGLEYTSYKDPVEEGSIYNPLNYDWKIGIQHHGYWNQ